MTAGMNDDPYELTQDLRASMHDLQLVLRRNIEIAKRTQQAWRSNNSRRAEAEVNWLTVWIKEAERYVDDIENVLGPADMLPTLRVVRRA
jgi:hypothetical protein